MNFASKGVMLEGVSCGHIRLHVRMAVRLEQLCAALRFERLLTTIRSEGLPTTTRLERRIYVKESSYSSARLTLTVEFPAKCLCAFFSGGLQVSDIGSPPVPTSDGCPVPISDIRPIPTQKSSRSSIMCAAPTFPAAVVQRLSDAVRQTRPRIGRTRFSTMCSQ